MRWPWAGLTGSRTARPARMTTRMPHEVRAAVPVAAERERSRPGGMRHVRNSRSAHTLIPVREVTMIGLGPSRSSSLAQEIGGQHSPQAATAPRRAAG